jgi:hypothetical protein
MQPLQLRHQVIDRLLHEVLAWPRTSVSCEEDVHPGYCDHSLAHLAVSMQSDRAL